MQTTNNNVNVFAKYKSHNSDLLPPPPPPPQITPSTLIVFSIGIIIFCFLGFTILFFCRCCFVNISSTTTLVHLSPNASPYRGLDPSTLQTFPTFLYATVKDLRKEKYSLECAVCLAEFDNDSMLRLLTVCYHVFHQDCIDLWLRSHKTCPVCRTDLESPTNEDEKAPEQDTNVGEERRDHDHDHDHNHIHSCEHDRDHACIDVREDDGDQIHKEDEGGNEQGASAQEQEQEQNIFARSHSTGHSVVMVREGTEGRDGDDDNYNKYTLRLPEHVALKIVRGGHIYSKSCSSYKDMTMVGAPCSNCGYVQSVLDGSSHNDTKTN